MNPNGNCGDGGALLARGASASKLVAARPRRGPTLCTGRVRWSNTYGNGAAQPRSIGDSLGALDRSTDDAPDHPRLCTASERPLLLARPSA